MQTILIVVASLIAAYLASRLTRRGPFTLADLAGAVIGTLWSQPAGRTPTAIWSLVHNQAAFWDFRYVAIALVCARRNLQSTICNLQLH